MEDSIFTRIIKGEIPSYKIYEDDTVYAFLDIHPIQSGQVLVVPKHQVRFVWELDDTDYTALMLVVKKVAQRLKQLFPGKTHIGVHVEGLEVDHAHVKVFPFSSHQEFVHHPDQTAEPDHRFLADIAEKLKL